IEIAQFAGAAPRGLKLQYEQTLQISIRNGWGEPLTFASLRASDGSYRRYVSVSNNSSLNAKAHGHLVVVNFGAEIIGIDALRGERTATDSLLWRQDSADLDTISQRTIYPSQRSVSNPFTGSRYVSYDPSGRMNFDLGPMQTSGLCYQKGRQLICVDLLTGESIWERSQVPAQAEIFGDGEFIFVADASGDEVQVISAIDGALAGRRKIDRSDRRWTTRGRNVLAWEQTGTTLKLRLYDAWQQDAQGQHPDLWSRQVPQGTKGFVIDGEELALLEPSGQFTVVSLDTGELRFAVPLDPEPALDSILVQRTSDQYVLMTNQNNPTPPPGLLPSPVPNSAQVRLHGRAYAFARSTGKLQWQVPAFVAAHCLLADQPTETPLLLFVRNQRQVGEGNNNLTNCHVLCLDKRDGRVVFDNVVGQQAMSCDAVADPVKRTVTMTIATQPKPTVLTFTATDKPSAPQPPAQTGEAASDSVGQLPGTVDRSVGAAIERLNRGADPSQLAPLPPPVRLRAPNAQPSAPPR
ncbi:MAG TPA: PQQ-binding-like beta-propeller repeat protein, partial [Pirellulaceae bacterium]|nr:PQQ-binding-like beta-propeller repeat protein [Pirellulaceae bacterium]